MSSICKTQIFLKIFQLEKVFKNHTITELHVYYQHFHQECLSNNINQQNQSWFLEACYNMSTFNRLSTLYHRSFSRTFPTIFSAVIPTQMQKTSINLKFKLTWIINYYFLYFSPSRVHFTLTMWHCISRDNSSKVNKHYQPVFSLCLTNTKLGSYSLF